MPVKTAYVAVGSNINPDIHVPEALIVMRKEFRISSVSTHYRTEPLNNRKKEERYLNGVWKIHTGLVPGTLKKIFGNIEDQFGRIRRNDSYAPRTLDLDLLLWDNLIDNELGLPDMDILVRPFLYGPLLELDKELLWPLTRRPLRDMVDSSQVSGLEADEKMTELLRGIIDG
jgi:2-amino-4-hydroxy-6-hydroxymethyldihydropteridine diphosphokinase